MIKRTERGWGGHFCMCSSCLFRRNTLLELGEVKIIVSTVGNYITNDEIVEIGYRRYYETMAFHSSGDIYNDSDVAREVSFDSQWSLDFQCDNSANGMHELVVEEITQNLMRGEYGGK